MTQNELEKRKLLWYWKTNNRWRHVARRYGPEEVLRRRESRPPSSATRGSAELFWELLRGGVDDVADPRLPLPGRSNYRELCMPPVAPEGAGADINPDLGLPFLAPATTRDAFTTARALIRSGAAAIHVDDISATDAPGRIVEELTAARLAADTEDIPAVLIVRTRVAAGEVDRVVSYAPFTDVSWLKVSESFTLGDANELIWAVLDRHEHVGVFLFEHPEGWWLFFEGT